MTAAAAVAISGSAGRVVPVPGAVSDGAPGQSPLGAPSRLADLKVKRSDLRARLDRLLEARAELEEPNRILADIEAEAQGLEASTAAALSLWAQQGCEGQRPIANPERMVALDRQRQATQQAIDANAEAVLELARQQAAARQRLAGIDSEIVAEAAAVLAAGLDAEMAAIRTAAAELNQELARALGLRILCLEHRGNYAFALLAERISQLQTPAIGSTRAQIEAAAEGWRQRFKELAE